ncbi:Trichodiene oxygenase [Colletotrichum higginsianum]|uniref:Trichodiene oxygenase n=1 Tax=Colletotrichum higginsianum TaxID=80884 RepID=A0A4T0W9I7_9PEZI|nr:Trichodiene oxygenase [Colletotrichum higginsianum]
MVQSSVATPGKQTSLDKLHVVPGHGRITSVQALGSFSRRRTWFHKEHKTEINTETTVIMAWIFASQTTLSLENYWIRLLSPILIYLVAKYIWRAFLCPLANFPGPRMAGITKLYEAYHVLIKNDWLENLISLHVQYGPVVRIGPNELHFIDHKFSLEHHKRPDLLKCDNYYGILNKLLGGLVSPSDHSKRAASMRPIFSGQTFAEFAPTMDKHIESLHSRLTDAAADTEAVNLTHFLWAYTNDVMLSYVTEQDNGWLKNYDLGAVHDTTRAFSAIDLATIFRCMPPLKMMLDVFPAIRSYSPLGWLDELVASHLRPIVKSWDGENSHQGILSRIFSEIGNETCAVQESSQAIFIGNESLLSNLTFVVHHLVKNPECVKKIRAELDTLDIGTYGHRVWRDQKISGLKYLDAVCKESTRLSSPGWHRQPRQSQTPVDYHGTIIPAMTSLSFTLHLLEHDPELFPEPDTFKPERWLGYSEESKAARSHSVTFGTGTRTCLGQHIANKVLRKTVAFLVYNFNITLWNEKLDRTEGYRYLSTYPKKGHEGYMRVRLNPRFSCDS